MLIFRKATHSDLPELLKFPQDQQELFYFFPSANFPLTLEQLEQQLSKGYESTVMVENHQLVGFANFYKVKKHNIAFIGNVIIRPDRRREGLGRKLIEKILTTGFTELKVNEVHLSCYESNLSAMQFYTGLGFNAYAREQRPNQDNHPVALIHLKRTKT